MKASDQSKDRTRNAKNNAFENAKNQASLLSNAVGSVVNGRPLGMFPESSSGARTFITINNKLVAFCLDFSYSIQASFEEVRSIDSQFPWDINIDQVRISGQLSRIASPDGSLESESLFHTMKSILHQPKVNLVVQDANGNTNFFCTGMFTGMSTRSSMGQLTVQTAQFVGFSYQHWVFQGFEPNAKKNGFQRGLDSIKKAFNGNGF